MQRKNTRKIARFRYVRLHSPATLLRWAAFSCAAPTASQEIATQRINGPLPINATDYPFDAANHHKVPATLADWRYVEEEFFLRGAASLYQLDDDSPLPTAVASGPFVTRLLVRRPDRVERFSGNVVVELYNAAARFDQAFIWADAHDYFLANGDIWIGVTARPSAVAALKRFNPARYGALSWASPDRRLSTCPTPPDGSGPDTENGLVYDILTQVGRLVRNKNAAGNPLARYRIRAVFAAGFSQTASVLATYVGMIAPRDTAKRPVFDGYFIDAAIGRAPLSQCARPLPADDPRAILHGGDAAIVQLQTQSDFAQGVPSRRPDGDAPHDRYRLYEMPGISHVNASQTAFLPGETELAAVGLPSVDKLVAGCDLKGPFNPLPSGLITRNAFAKLEDWVRLGKAPPHAERIATQTDTNGPTPLLDRFGNARGGVRTPYLDAPRFTYFASSPGQAARCRLYGYVTPLDSVTLTAEYSDPAEYKRRALQSAGQLAAQGWLTDADAKSLTVQIATAPVAW